MVEQLYNNIGGDYSKAISRMQNDERIKKYLGFFIQDDSYEKLKIAIENKNCEDAFRAAHTLKGVCQNMSFEALSKIAVEITEELRANKLEDAIKTFPKVKEQYEIVIQEINKII